MKARPYIYTMNAQIMRGPTPIDFQALVDREVKTIINLRSDAYAMAFEESLAKRYDMYELFVPSCPLMPPSDRAVRAVLSVLHREEYGPFFIHCRWGKDRTGYVCAVIRVVRDGWTVEQAIQEMRGFGFRRWAFFWWEGRLRRLCRELRWHA